MSTVKVKWTASSELIRKECIETGNFSKAEREFEIDLTEILPVERSIIIDTREAMYMLDMSYLRKFDAESPFGDFLSRETRKYNHQPTFFEVFLYCKEYLEEKARAEAYKAEMEAKKRGEKERIAALKAEWQPKLDALIEAKDLDGLNKLAIPTELTALNWQANKAWQELKTRLAEQEKRAWVAQFGSAHLREAVASGYDCQREYILQRAAKEFPSFSLDFNARADWKARSCPSPAALTLARKVNGTVVWLTAPPSSDIPDCDYEDYCEPFLPCEAVVIEKYLDKYTLVQIV